MLLVALVELVVVPESVQDLMSTLAVYKAWVDLEASVVSVDLTDSQAIRQTCRDLPASEA